VTAASRRRPRLRVGSSSLLTAFVPSQVEVVPSFSRAFAIPTDPADAEPARPEPARRGIANLGQVFDRRRLRSLAPRRQDANRRAHDMVTPKLRLWARQPAPFVVLPESSRAHRSCHAVSRLTRPPAPSRHARRVSAFARPRFSPRCPFPRPTAASYRAGRHPHAEPAASFG
jgi:hypothetical protein